MSLGKIAIFSFIGLGSALAFASGCGPAGGDSYYCDDKGCYTCDGLGCASVPPPTKAPCQSNAVCGADSVCTTDGCAKKCATDTACPRGDALGVDADGALRVRDATGAVHRVVGGEVSVRPAPDAG